MQAEGKTPVSSSVMQCPQGVCSAQQVEGTPAPRGWGGARSIPWCPCHWGPLTEPEVEPEEVGALLCITMKSSVPGGPSSDYHLMKTHQCVFSPCMSQIREWFLVLGLILPAGPGL